MVTVPVPKIVVLADETTMIPFCTVPDEKVAVVPFTVSVTLLRSMVPLVSVILLTAVLAFSMQLLVAVTIFTSSAAPGMPAGVQLPGVVHEEEREPFQV